MTLVQAFNNGDYELIVAKVKPIALEDRSFNDHYFYLKSQNRLSNIEVVIDYSLNIIENDLVESDIEYLKIIHELIRAYHKNANWKDAKKWIKSAKKRIDTLTNNKSLNYEENQTVISILNLAGIIEYSSGNLEKAKIYFDQILNSGKTDKNPNIIQGGKINLGLIHLDKGEYPKSIKFFKEALELAEKNDHLPHIRVASNNLSYIYNVTGNLQKAETYTKKTMNVANLDSDKWGKALALTNLGEILHKKGNYQSALDNLSDAKNIMMEFDNPEYISRILFQEFLIHLELYNRNKAGKLLQQIEDQANLVDHKRTQLIYQIAEAIYLRFSGLYRQKMQAESKLKKLLQSNLEIERELLAYVYLSLTALYLEQLAELQSKFGDTSSEIGTKFHEEEKSLVNEVKNLSDTILKIAREQNAPILLIQAHYIIAHLSIIRLDFDTLNHHLEGAKQISDEFGLEGLTIPQPDLSKVSEADEFDIIKLTDTIDNLIHSLPRLKIMVSLANSPRLTFTELQESVDLSSGNVSNHCKILIDGGYIVKKKQVVNGKFQVTYRLTTLGTRALEKYRSTLTSFLLTQ